MQIRPLCGQYTRVNIHLRVKSIGGNDVFLTLPYQINSLPGHVRLLTKKQIREQMLLRIPLGGLDGMLYF